MKEYMAVVDENDRVMSKKTRNEIVVKNLLHRGIAVFVFNSKGEIFVHKRNRNKKYYPGYYDAIVGGGLKHGETYNKGAKREVREEIGAKDIKLQFLFKNRFKNNIDNHIANVYKIVYDGKIKLQKSEIEWGKFMAINELKELMKKKKFAPDLIKIFRRYMREFHND
ncbi:NUDIX domain-containing protein [Candidatus Woesearchaeota archaeon]|nr:NUDIX domain-containing protein [Candidatus Woesearchaeota archaeon]